MISHGIDIPPLNYRIDGAEGLPWLVLSNGLGLDLTMWDPQMPALTRVFRVLRYDTRGHGASPTPADPCTIEQLGGDVLALLDEVGAAQAHVCGFSMGGIIAMWLGVHAADRVDKLVLAHTAAQIGPVSMWNDRIAVVKARGMSAISAAAMERWFTPDFLAREPSVVDALRQVFESNDAQGYVCCCAAIRDADFRATITQITVPTMVISGTRDAATTLANGHLLAARIPGAGLVEIDAAHLSNFEQPSTFTAALLGFLVEGRSRVAPQVTRQVPLEQAR